MVSAHLTPAARLHRDGIPLARAVNLWRIAHRITPADQQGQLAQTLKALPAVPATAGPFYAAFLASLFIEHVSWRQIPYLATGLAQGVRAGGDPQTVGTQVMQSYVQGVRGVALQRAGLAPPPTLPATATQASQADLPPRVTPHGPMGSPLSPQAHNLLQALHPVFPPPVIINMRAAGPASWPQ